MLGGIPGGGIPCPVPSLVYTTLGTPLCVHHVRHRHHVYTTGSHTVNVSNSAGSNTDWERQLCAELLLFLLRVISVTLRIKGVIGQRNPPQRVTMRNYYWFVTRSVSWSRTPYAVIICLITSRGYPAQSGSFSQKVRKVTESVERVTVREQH